MKIAILSFFFIFECFCQDTYYTNANINFKKEYYQVPMDEVIWSKFQAGEPHYFYKGPYKGKGWSEALDDKIILALRKENIKIYVDYFTTIKANAFYGANPNYTICSRFGEIYKNYKSVKNKNDVLQNKYAKLSIPLSIRWPIMQFAIRSNKVKTIQKYKYPHSNVYSVQSIINDPDLYTVYQSGTYTALTPYLFGVYLGQNNVINPKYKKRVYEFVASDAIQLIMMLRGNRMHYVDMTQYYDYHIKLLKIQKDVMELFDYSHKDPREFIDDDLRVTAFFCRAPIQNKKIVDNAINIIDREVKKYRTNLDFISKSFKQYLLNTNQKIVDYKDFPFFKLGLDYMQRLEKGDFDK